jgi:hypothetical protein
MRWPLKHCAKLSGAFSAGEENRETVRIDHLAGVATAEPLHVRTQQNSDAGHRVYECFPDDSAHLIAAFQLGLLDPGFVEGQTISIEYCALKSSLNSSRAIRPTVLERTSTGRSTRQR